MAIFIGPANGGPHFFTGDDMSDGKYRDLGNISISGANDANVPVDIWLSKDDEGGGYTLTADNYMPRKGRLSGEESYKAWAPERQTLVDLVHEHWLPLYLTAVDKLRNLTEDEHGNASLYYWSGD